MCAVAAAVVHAVPAAIQRNLVLRFKDDTIDDSLQLTQLLQNRWAGGQVWWAGRHVWCGLFSGLFEPQ